MARKKITEAQKAKMAELIKSASVLDVAAITAIKAFEDLLGEDRRRAMMRLRIRKWALADLKKGKMTSFQKRMRVDIKNYQSKLNWE